MNINICAIVSDLTARGFVSDGNGSWLYASGSISHFTKCRVCLGYCMYSDMADGAFYSVRYESFAESGDPAFDHHDISERYVSAEHIADFMRSKGILTSAEREARWAEFRRRARG